MDTKVCIECLKEFPLSDFHKHFSNKTNKTWYDKRCRFCRCAILKEWRTQNPEIVKNNRNNYRNSFDGFIKCVIIDTRGRSKKKNISFDLTESFIRQLWEDQKGLCAISGQPLQYTREPGTRVSPFRASLDKINPAEGYIIGNVRWTCYFANLMKNDHSEQDFLSYIKMIAKYNNLTD